MAGKLKLPTVTCVCVDCVDAKRAIEVLEICKSRVDFGAVKLLTSIETDYEHAVTIFPLTSLVMYSIFVLKELYKYIDTEHLLIVQKDGWVINPQSWNPEWLGYDYIAPLFNQYEPPRMGAGGFSLRSNKLMKEVSYRVAEWNGTLEDANRIQSMVGLYEDGYLALIVRERLERGGFKYGTIEEACKFAAGGNYNKKYYVRQPFGYHQGSYFYQCKETGTDTGIVNEKDYADVPI
jgi:hypothetical protein